MHFSILARMGLAPGRDVAEEEVEYEDGAAVYRVALSDEPAMACPSCGRPGLIHGHYVREVRLTVNAALPEVALVRVPRFVCRNPLCERSGSTFSPRIAGMAEGASIPASLKMLAVGEAASSTADLKSIAERHGMSPRTLTAAFDELHRAVPRGRLGEVLCVDEFRFSSHGRSRFPVILVDGVTGFLIDVAESRQKAAMASYFSSIPEEERAAVRYLASDMYEGFRYVRAAFFRGATHVADLFHVVALLKVALGKERARAFRKPDASSPESYSRDYSFLKSHWKLTVRREGKPAGPWPGEDAASLARKVSRAKAILASRPGLIEMYDALQALYGLVDGAVPRGPGEQLAWIEGKLISSGLPEAERAAGTLRRWEREILAAFESEREWMRVTNAASEGMNNRIATLSKAGFGLRSFERMRRRALLVFGRPWR